MQRSIVLWIAFALTFAATFASVVAVYGWITDEPAPLSGEPSSGRWETRPTVAAATAPVLEIEGLDLGFVTPEMLEAVGGPDWMLSESADDQHELQFDPRSLALESLSRCSPHIADSLDYATCMLDSSWLVEELRDAYGISE